MKLKSIKLLIPSNYRLSYLGQLALKMSDDFTLTVKFQSSFNVKLKTVACIVTKDRL